MADNLKYRTGIAFFWSLLDKGGQQLIQFVIIYVMARLVTPEEMGMVAVLSIFTAMATVLQDSGFASALIRKKEVTQTEYTSVFCFNVFISILIYLLFFLLAPLLSSFYDRPLLTPLSRFVFLAFVFNAFGIIQNVNLIRTLDFKTNTRITFAAGIVSGIVAITMAYYGYGTWAIAAQTVSLSLVRNILLWVFIRWKPTGTLSFAPLREMLPYSSKLLANGILNQLCGNIYPTIIGKFFSFSQAGFYSQARKFNDIPQMIIGDGLKNVAFPLLSQVNEDSERRKRAFRKIIRITCFISFPITLLLILLAEPVILVALSAKWLGVVPLLQIIAAGCLLYPLHLMTGPLLQALGKSGLILKLETSRNLAVLLSILITVRWGVEGLVWGLAIVNMLFYITELLIVARKIEYKAKELFLDVIPFLQIALLAFLPMILFNYFLPDSNVYFLALLQTLLGCLLYLLITKLSGAAILKETVEFVKHFLKRNKE